MQKERRARLDLRQQCKHRTLCPHPPPSCTQPTLLIPLVSSSFLLLLARFCYSFVVVKVVLCFEFWKFFVFLGRFWKWRIMIGGYVKVWVM